MQTSIVNFDEKKRLKAVKSYQLSRSQNSSDFNNITDLAIAATNLPISLISIVDENDVWIKSAKGMNICSTQKEFSFCNHAIGDPNDIFIVEDATIDPRFLNNPFTQTGTNPVIFYAGVSLIDKNNYRIGTLCVVDSKPNRISKEQKEVLMLLAKQTVKLIELNRYNKRLKRTRKKLSEKNKQLKDFAGQVAHDMKMPLANMIVTSDIIKSKYKSQLDSQGVGYLDNLKSSSLSLSDYINNLLGYYESNTFESTFPSETFSLNQLIEEVIDILNIKINCSIEIPKEDIELHTNKAALEQILINLLTNSLKYNDKDDPEIIIDQERKDSHVIISVTDNGMGIPKEKKKQIFELFSTLEHVDRFGNKGHGIGLSTVKKLVNSLGGKIRVKSQLGQGTSFIFSIKTE